MSTEINIEVPAPAAVVVEIQEAPTGAVGPAGPAGPAGADGADGAEGPEGPAGASAYESYVATTSDDPVLTEAEWADALAGLGVRTYTGLQRATAQNVFPATDDEVTTRLSGLRYALFKSASGTRITPLHGWTANAVVNGSQTVVSATGASLAVVTSTTAGSEAYIRMGGFQPQIFARPGGGSSVGIDWAGGGFYVGFRCILGHGNSSNPVATTEGWFRIGHSRTLATFGAPTTACIGWKYLGGDIFPFVHDGTTLNLSVTAAFTTLDAIVLVPVLEIVSLGGGVFQFWVNGVLIDTLTGGPTGTSGQEGTGVSLGLRNPAGGTNTNGNLQIVNGEIWTAYL